MKPQLFAAFFAAATLCSISAATPLDAEYLSVTVSCRDNPACVYDGKDMYIDIVITNVSAEEIGFPLAYLTRQGPTVRLIDSASKAEIPLRINLAPRALRNNFTVLKPGESVALDTIIHGVQLLTFRQEFVDVIAFIAPSVKIQVSQQPQLVDSVGKASLRIVGADTLEHGPR
jgi:hypothetical protein